MSMTCRKWGSHAKSSHLVALVLKVSARQVRVELSVYIWYTYISIHEFVYKHTYIHVYMN